MANQEKQERLTVSTDATDGHYIEVDRSRAEALKAYLAENGFSTTHHEGTPFDFLKLGSADPEEIQMLLDEWTG
jgi:hypothetical protein